MNEEELLKILNKEKNYTEEDLLLFIYDLRKQNTELKEKINTYENPEDLTLMFMYCDEKAKDKIKELKDNWNKLKEWLEERIKYYKDIGYINTSIAFEFVLEKLQEIEGEMNE